VHYIWVVKMANIHYEHSSANQAFPHLIKSETKF